MARIWVADGVAQVRTIWDYAPQPILAALGQHLPDAEAQLAALLAAGTDDAGWGSYHETLTLTISRLVEEQASLLPNLIAPLRAADGGVSWQRLRIVLGALAACAPVVPTLFNQTVPDIEALLIAATRYTYNHDVRRFAITCLAHLRVVSGAGLMALLELSGDLDDVRDDAIAAAGRFNRLHANLGSELPSALRAALLGPSGARAYVALKLLAALGSSAAAASSPGLRQAIIALLAEALHSPARERLVWLNRYSDEGPLEQHLYVALLRVAGV